MRAAPPHSPAAPRTTRVFPTETQRGLLTLLDDIDVQNRGQDKIAVKKRAGVLGDDLVLSAQQVADVAPHRELPVV